MRVSAEIAARRSHEIECAFGRIVGGLRANRPFPRHAGHGRSHQARQPRPIFFKAEALRLQQRADRGLQIRSNVRRQCDATATRLVQKGDSRVTRVGASSARPRSTNCRSSSTSCFKGNLSLVGPRPHAVHAKAADQLYDDAVDGYFARHRVKPGITGWAQNQRLARRDRHRGEDPEARRARSLLHREIGRCCSISTFLAKTPLALAKTENAY